MKQSILWHKQCAANAKLGLAAKERDLAHAQALVERARALVDFYDRQIAEAQKRGLSEFNSDRLLVSKKKPTVAE